MPGLYWSKTNSTQECIPVGCVPAARWPYAGVYFPGGVCSWGGLLPGGCLFLGVSARGEVSALGGGVSAPRGCLLLGGCLLRGVCSLGCLLLGGVCSGGSAPWGVCSWGVFALGGVSAQGGFCSWGSVCSWGVSQHALRQTPRTDSQMPVKTLPWPNFVQS